MLCIVGFDGFFRAVNPAFEKRLGIPQAELTAEPWLSWVHPDDAAATQAAIEQLSPNHSPITLDTRLRHSDGTYTFYQWTATYDPAGIYAVVQPLYEVTDYVRAREKLVESEEQFRAIVNQSVVGIAEKDLSGRYILVNDRFCEMVGYSRDELLTKRLHDITHPDDLPRNAFLFEQMISEGKNVVIEKRYVRKDGSIIWVQNTMSLVRDANGDKQYALEMSFDLTSIKAAEEALMERQREKAVLEERQRLARELHDSVTQSLFSAGVITESIPHMLQRQPDKALIQLDHLGSLIRGASAELRTLLWELRPDKIAQAGLASLLTQLAYSVQARKSLKVFLRVHGDYEQPLPPDVLMAFYRIAQESINNIIKHSDATRIKIMMRRTETYVMMDILDDGLGFDNSSGKSGFGLMIMRERAEEAGARLDIFSSNGKGTRVRLFWQGEVDTNVVSIE